MAVRFGLALTMTLLLVGSAAAQTQVIVNENFDSYADTIAFQAAWGPSNGLGTVALGSGDPNYLGGVTTNDPLYASAIPDVQGNAVDHVGSMVNQWGGAFDPVLGQTPDFTINPSDTQSVFLSADIFVGTSGNERMSVGLRATLPDSGDADALADTDNLIELGSWNANPDPLGIPGTAQVSANFAFRAQLFGGSNPNWQYFELPIELDRPEDTDTIVNVSDVGAGWHTYAVTITPTSMTFTIDLFRDGKRNTSTVIDVETGERPGIDGQFDGTVVFDNLTTSDAGFNNLRLGAPSGLSSIGAGLYGFDNILLQLQPAAVDPGGDNADFNGDNIVDGADFLIWQVGFGAPGTLTTGDANGDLAVNDLDLAIFKTQYGTDPTPAVGAIGAVPEPTTLALAGLAMVAAGLAARRR
jgi:hypothetical protein